MILALAASIPAALAAAAPGVHRLSDGADRVAADLARNPASGTTVLVLDEAAIGRQDLQDLMFAPLDCRQAGGRTVAVVATRDANGCLALACGHCTFVGDASIRGLDADAVASASQRERLAMDIATLGGVPLELAAALVDPGESLYFENGAFSSATTGATAIRLASRGQPVELDQATLRVIGLASGLHDTVDAAIRAAQAGTLPPLASPASQASRGTPPGPTVPPSKPSGTGTPTAPATPSAPSSSGKTPTGSTVAAGDGLDPDIAKKTAPKMKEYAETLAKLKDDIKEFNEYFKGTKGIWTSRNKGLKQVWLDSAEQTRDKNTALACSRLQRDIKTSIQKLESAVNTVGRIIKDNAHPEIVRLSRNGLVLDALRAAIERNRAADYETAAANALKLVP